MTPVPHVRDDLNRRIELVSMDRFCDDITIALYVTQDGMTGTVHSYSRRDGVPERLSWLAEAMRTLGGMRLVGDDGRTVSFVCESWHELAARRVFLEACKLDPAVPVTPRPLEVDDIRKGQHIKLDPLGGGGYVVLDSPLDPGPPVPVAGRSSDVAAGLAKLAALSVDPDDDTRIQFDCGAPHDELAGLLLPRAINIRAALREQEMAAGRGILVAPSAQEAAAS